MFTNLFGNYLVNKGVIDTEQLKQIKAAQAKTRVKLGLIAVTEKLMTQKQADAINERQSMLDQRFGDIAVEMELLTREQVKHLLMLQGSPYITFTQTVTDLGIMSLEDVENNLLSYQTEHGYTSMDIDAVKSGDIDRIMPLILPEELPWNTAEHIAVALRTINRIACDDIYVKNAEIVSEYKAKGYAIQKMYGDFTSSTSIAGSKEGLLAIASGFAKESFDELELEALDSLAELTNIIDGLFATSVSHDLVEVSLMPPELSADEVVMSASKICKVSLEAAGYPVDILISVGTEILTNKN